MKTTSGRVTVRRVEPRAVEPRQLVKRVNFGRKVVGLKVGEGVSIDQNITIVRIDNGPHGAAQFVIEAPLSVVLGNAEPISLTS